MFIWYNPSNSTFRVWHISYKTWYYMHVYMEYTLPSRFSYINPYVKSVRVVFFINDSFDLIRKS